MARDLLLAIDQGTTSSRALVFDADLNVVSLAQREFRQIYPADGWVEHDATEIWTSTRAVCAEAIAAAGGATRIAAAGITNQRETTVLWNRTTGEPVGNAIVWQDRRGAQRCEELRAAGHEALLTERTGLLADSYFSATKLEWMLSRDDELRRQAEAGELAFGTIDCWLLWNLTGGRVHATDVSNASRTLLFNIHTLEWDSDLLELFSVPAAVLPDVRPNAADYGVVDTHLFGGDFPVGGMAGDQQSALIGQACFEPGMVKATYGTGCFMLLNTGEQAVISGHRLLSTVAYQLDGPPVYALEGSIFNAGTAIKWLRDELGLIDRASESETMATSVESPGRVTFVPAFTGLGAPHWEPDARGLIAGLTRDTGRAEVVRAALEAVAFQSNELFELMVADAGKPIELLRVDGGMTANDWLLQELADVCGVAVTRPALEETTAAGAALLAGMSAGIYASTEAMAATWRADRNNQPLLEPELRLSRVRKWARAVAAVRALAED